MNKATDTVYGAVGGGYDLEVKSQETDFLYQHQTNPGLVKTKELVYCNENSYNNKKYHPRSSVKIGIFLESFYGFEGVLQRYY